MRRRHVVVLVVLGGFLAWVALHMLEMQGTNPVLEARAVAQERGWVSPEADLLGGGYGTHLVRRFAYATLREPDGGSEVTVRLEKWVPFAAWSTVTVRSDG